MARMKFICDSGRCIKCNTYVAACENEYEVLRGVNRRRVATINDGMTGVEKSISVTCMHCLDAPCIAVCPVDCFYRIKDDVALHNKDVCIDCGYCLYVCPFGTPQFLSQDTPGVRSKMDRCAPYAGSPEKNGSEGEFEKYGHSRLVGGKPPLCAEMCLTKALLGGGGNVTSDILHNRVMKRGKGAELFGWGTVYGGTQGKSGQAIPATPVTPVKSVPVSGA